MAKIGRNDPCPCGSGKKYKNCHWGKQLKESSAAGKNNPMKLSYMELIGNYNLMPILKLLGGLQLCPSNHAKTVRLEQMARLCLLGMQKNKVEKLNAHWELLKGAIENYTDYSDLEDEPTTAFTENAVFAEGNYIVYPGPYVSGTRILNELLECIFLMKNELPEGYKKQINDAAGLLLFMSNSAAKDINQGRYIYEEGLATNIIFPEYDQAMEYVSALSFPKEYVKKICQMHRYEESILHEFLAAPEEPGLMNDDPDQNIVNKKPLIEEDDEIILYMPGSIISALTDFIYEKAKKHNCYIQVIELLQQNQFDKTCAALTNMNWIEKNVELPPDYLQLPIQEAVFQFDNQKLGYLCFIGKRFTNPETNDMQKENFSNPFGARNEQVVNYLASFSVKQPFQVLSIFVLAETGHDYLFAWPKSPINHLSLTFSYTEIDTIAYDANSNILTLWKFAKVYSRTNELFHIEAFGGTLDIYVAYQNNNGSFLNSDETNPIGGRLFIPVGYSNNFLRKIQVQRDEHAAVIFYKMQKAYTKVIRYKQYAPIYIEKEPLMGDRNRIFRLLIETYKMPIWINNYHTPEKDEESLPKYLCEGVAFWLHKMKDSLTPILESLTFIQFEIEIVIDEKLNTIQEYDEAEQDIEKVAIEIKIDAPKIKIFIPFEFMYLVRRSDNYADKLLMKAVLNGLVKYVDEAKDTILLTDNFINEIIEKVLQPSNAKMLLFSDASWNIRLDSRGLPPMRYINEADISYILDNLVSYLPVGYNIPKQINGKQNKLNLCRDIVSALIKRISEKLESYDGEQLLKWLIKMNEKCLQLREFREIMIPAKIACFSDFESEVEELLEKGENHVVINQSIRILIEFVAAKLPCGSKWPNFDEVEELLALVYQLISWGTESDSIWKNLADPQMGLLPSGRIGTEKLLQKQVFTPYAFAKSTSKVFQYVENWGKNYGSKATTSATSIQKLQSEKLNDAFQAEFGISMQQLIQIIWVLVGEGYKNAKACMILEGKALSKLIREKTDNISEKEVDVCISLLTLLTRENIGNYQDGFEHEEIYPWRHKRALSYLRRPLAKVVKEEGSFYYYGYRHLIDYLDNLHYLLYEGKFPNAVSGELLSWLGTASSGKGNPFREEVRKWFETKTEFEVIPYEVDISPSGPLKAKRDYGDIDLLVIDHTRKIIYIIECKNITGGKTVYEMWSEISAYLGENKNDDDAKIIKHVKRAEWLQNNKETLKIFVPNVFSYEIKSFVLSADEVPLAYLKKHYLPLPLKSFVFLRKNGIDYLVVP